MVTAANKRGWGWPGSPDSEEDRRYRREHLTRLRVAGVTLLVRKEVAPLFEGFINELTAGGYTLNGRADDWGYANRDVRGRPGVKSNHAWGLAVDLNATTNPMTDDGRTHTDLPSNVSRMAAKYGLRWGGDYDGRKDPMHFEFIGTPQDAQEYVRHIIARRAPSQPSQDTKELDVDEKDLRRIIGEELDERIALILRGDKTHPDNLKAIHADVEEIKKLVK